MKVGDSHALFPSCCSTASTGNHASRRTVQISHLGTRSVGAGSNAPSRISISPLPGAMLNIVDPQIEQICRESVVAVQLAVSPAMVTSSACQTGMTAKAPPPSRRQTAQWQMATLIGSPRVVMRTAPQLVRTARLVPEATGLARLHGGSPDAVAGADEYVADLPPSPHRAGTVSPAHRAVAVAHGVR